MLCNYFSIIIDRSLRGGIAVDQQTGVGRVDEQIFEGVPDPVHHFFARGGHARKYSIAQTEHDLWCLIATYTSPVQKINFNSH